MSPTNSSPSQDGSSVRSTGIAFHTSRCCDQAVSDDDLLDTRLSETEQTHYAELGEMVFWFASVENLIYTMLGAVLANPRAAPVILKEFQLAKAIDVLIKLVAAQTRNEDDNRCAFEKALREFKDCAVARNELLHSVCRPAWEEKDPGKFLSVFSGKTGKETRRARSHVADLTTRSRRCGIAIVEAALALGLFKPAGSYFTRT
jgi:hypothetical protein